MARPSRSPRARVLSAAAAVVVCWSATTRPAGAFVPAPPRRVPPAVRLLLAVASPESEAAAAATATLSLSLAKPLGLILEEAEEGGGGGGGGGGVIVMEVNEGGSAYESPSRGRLVGSRIGAVMGTDVSAAGFDDVMDAIIGAPSPVDVEFIVTSDAAAEVEAEAEEAPGVPTYEVGTFVSITVQQPETNNPDISIEAKVGDNLRKALLASGDVELYRGLKKKLGNCGGGGQCGHCAVELVDDSEGGAWGERSEYEARKIGRNGNENCRLACLNNVVGPATVRTL